MVLRARRGAFPGAPSNCTQARPRVTTSTSRPRRRSCSSCGAPRKMAVRTPRAASRRNSWLPPPPALAPPAAAIPDEASAVITDPAPLPPVESLTIESDYAPFMRPAIDEATKRAALKKLFSDPSFNVMDGLDIYVGDYTQPDPMPPGMLEKLSAAYAAVAPAESPEEPRVGAEIAEAEGDGAAAPSDEPAAEVAAEPPSPPGVAGGSERSERGGRE